MTHQDVETTVALMGGTPIVIPAFTTVAYPMTSSFSFKRWFWFYKSTVKELNEFRDALMISWSVDEGIFIDTYIVQGMHSSVKTVYDIYVQRGYNIL